MNYADFCYGCRYFLDQRGGICGQGLSCKEQASLNECSRRVEGPPAKLIGEVKSYWEMAGNKRSEQVPKEIRFKGSKVLHYERSRKKRNRGYVTIDIILVYKLDLLPRKREAIMKALILDGAYSVDRNVTYGYADTVEVKVSYKIEVSEEFKTKRLGQSAKHHKKLTGTP